MSELNEGRQLGLSGLKKYFGLWFNKSSRKEPPKEKDFVTGNLEQFGFHREAETNFFRLERMVIETGKDSRVYVEYAPHVNFNDFHGIKKGDFYDMPALIFSYMKNGRDRAEIQTVDSGGTNDDERIGVQKSEFVGKSTQEQLKTAGFEQDQTQKEVWRQRLTSGKEKVRVVVITRRGKIRRVLKEVDPCITRLLGKSFEVIGSRKETRDVRGGAYWIARFRSEKIEFDMSPFGSRGIVVKGSQKLLREILPEEIGFKPLEPIQESSGFMMGGVNSTELIRSLRKMNGVPIAELEKEFRCRSMPAERMLGENESLLEVLATDNDYVLGKNLTHQQLGHCLNYAERIFRSDMGEYFTWHGRKFRVRISQTRAKGASFAGMERSSANMVVENLDTGASLWTGCLTCEMIKKYGFYQGPDSPYRIEPAVIIEVFDFLREEAR